MRHPARFSAIATTLFLLVPIWAAAQPAPLQPGAERDLIIVNHTAQPIVEVYVTPSDDRSWGDNRLADAAIKPGHSARIRLGRGRACGIDLRVVYRDGRAEDRHTIDACQMRPAVFEASAMASLPTADEQRPFTITNQGRLAIQELYVSPSTSGDWGDDLLHRQAIAPGGQATVTHDGVCIADLRVVFSNLAGEERRGVDICRHADIAIAPGWTTDGDLDAARPDPALSVSRDPHP